MYCPFDGWYTHVFFDYSPFSIFVRISIGNGKGRVLLYMTFHRGKPTLSLLT